MSVATPLVDSSVVSFGPPRRSAGAGYSPAFSYPEMPTHPPAWWFPAQQLASMVSEPQWASPLPPEPSFPGAVFANQVEVELGVRSITLPSAAYLDVEALEQQLGVPRPAVDTAAAPVDGEPAAGKSRKSRRKGAKRASMAEAGEGPAEVREALAALTQHVAAILESEPEGVPAQELRVAAAKLQGYGPVIQTFARQGSFKALKGAPVELAPFLHLLCTQMPAFTVKSRPPFTVRRGGAAPTAKKWVPTAPKQDTPVPPPARSPEGGEKPQPTA